MSEDPTETITEVRGTGIPVRGNDIDTDQIIPSRFLKAVTFDGLGQFAFFDQRFDHEDNPKEHPFNEDRFRDATVLVVNANFGCGSSREHAPEALKRWGIDAIVGESFAEIFAGNCLAMGLPTVTIGADSIAELQNFVSEHPNDDVLVNIEDERIKVGDMLIEANIDEAQYKALVNGVWDTTALMRSNIDSTRERARDLPYLNDPDPR